MLRNFLTDNALPISVLSLGSTFSPAPMFSQLRKVDSEDWGLAVMSIDVAFTQFIFEQSHKNSPDKIQASKI